MSAYAAQVAVPSRARAGRPHVGTRHLVLVANGSASGVRRSREALEGVRRSLARPGVRVEVHHTETITALASAWSAFEGRRVVLLGGDGTVHAAANLGPGPSELAIVPAGRANNIARALRIPLDPRAASELAVEGRSRRLDLIAATAMGLHRFVVEGVSVGFHARARAAYRAPNSADVLAAVRSALRAARSFDGAKLSLSSDGAAEVLTVGQLFIANLSLYAFGLRVAPDARPDDGLLDLITLPWAGRAHIIPMILQLRRGTHIRRHDTRRWTASRVRVATDGSSPVIADTTNLGRGPVTLEVARAALAVVAP
jgi:diacylglycerol kinase family enzyme